MTNSWTEITPTGVTTGVAQTSVSISGDRILFGVYGGRLYLYDGTTWTEQQPAGAANKNWRGVSIDGTNMVASIYGGRVYYYDGATATWSETQPAGDANKNWCAVGISGTKMIAGVYSGRLYYYDGATWAEQQPNGTATDYYWLGCGISGSEMIATAIHGGSQTGGRLWHYTGSAWEELRPDGVDKDHYYWCAAISDGKIAVGLAGTTVWPALPLPATCPYSVYYYNGTRWQGWNPGGDSSWTNISIYENKILVGKMNSLYFFNGSWWEAQRPIATTFYVGNNYAVSLSGSKLVVSTYVGAKKLYMTTWTTAGGSLSYPAHAGVYTLGRYSNKYPTVLDLTYPISENTFSEVEIGAILVVGSDFYVSWKRIVSGTATYGIDKIDYTAKYTGALFETRILGGNRTVFATLLDLVLAYTDLPTGTSFTVDYSTDYGTTWVSITMTQDTMRKVLAAASAGQEAILFQFRVSATVSANETPALERATIWLQ